MLAMKQEDIVWLIETQFAQEFRPGEVVLDASDLLGKMATVVATAIVANNKAIEDSLKVRK